MREVALLTFVGLFILSCGEKNGAKTIELKTFKDKLSYSLGADHARAISESGDPNFDKYNILEMVLGFKEGLKNEKAFGKDCQATMSKLFGNNGSEFNQSFSKEGSNCIGKISGVFFMSGWKQKNALSKIDIEKVIIGFEEGLKKTDSIIPRMEQATMVQNFMTDMNKFNGIKMIESAKKRKNAVTTASGIIVETIKDGTGGKPSPGDDILAHYILVNATGDTLQNSYEMVEQYQQSLTPFSLLAVVPGWQEGIPLMKKGGKYRLYLPYHLAYGEQGMFNEHSQSYEIQPYESLVFTIELLNYGKPGSLK